jgi:outer membrane protein OmpA-like peptidoglycan-associated protein
MKNRLMSTLPPLRGADRSVEDSKPRSNSRRTAQIGVVVLVITAGALWYLWDRVSTLKHQLADTEQRAESLDRQLEKNRSEAERLRQQSKSAQATAEAAQSDAEREATARQQAELEREFAREKADRARLDSERAEAEAAASRQEAEQLRKAREKELDRMKEALSHIAETSRTPLGMVVSLGEDRFLFDFDKADLKPENRELLSRIAGVLLASHGYRLYVYGHTDDVGTAEYNQGLSERRAKSVRDYLVKAGIPEEIIESKGFGKTSPRVPAKTQAARRKNRRVEIGVVDTIINYEKVVSENSR